MNLCLYTNSFPFGNGEQFIETEIKILSKYFEKIIIIPLNPIGHKRETPANVSIIQFKNTEYQRTRGLMFIGRWVIDFIKFNSSKKGVKYLISETLRFSSHVSLYYRFLKKNKLISNNYIHYTYWFMEAATVLSVIKNKGYLNKFVSRAHGYDLYDFRHPSGAIPFRKLQLKYVSKVYCVSKTSMNYLSQRYPSYKNKIGLSYLGVLDNGINPINKTNTLRIVSCSNIIALKRVQYIVEILSHLSIEVNWVHFGDGILMDRLNENVNRLPKNITFDLKGHVKNIDIIDYYRTNPIDVFIHLSETEGLPVSIQEAVSFGIPIIATDVGGVSEIVNNETGILIPKDFNILDVVQDLNSFKHSKFCTQSFRVGVRKFWYNNFNAETNYNAFFKELVKLIEK